MLENVYQSKNTLFDISIEFDQIQYDYQNPISHSKMWSICAGVYAKMHKPHSVIKKCMHEFQGHIQESKLGGNTN